MPQNVTVSTSFTMSTVLYYLCSSELIRFCVLFELCTFCTFALCKNGWISSPFLGRRFFECLCVFVTILNQIHNGKYKMSCAVCRYSNPQNWICPYCRFHNCAFRQICMVCHVVKDHNEQNLQNIKDWTLEDVTHRQAPYQRLSRTLSGGSMYHRFVDLNHFMKSYSEQTEEPDLVHRNTIDDDVSITVDDPHDIHSIHDRLLWDEYDDGEDEKCATVEYTEQEYAKWKDDMRWIISIIIREHGIKARKKLFKLEIITRNLMKMEPKYRRFPASKHDHSLLNGVKQFIDWIGYQTHHRNRVNRHHSPKFLILNVCDLNLKFLLKFRRI